jgi:hypothetical protein
MTYLEGTKYKLQADYYESIVLHCTYVEDNTVWFVHNQAASHGFDSNGPYTTKEAVNHYKLNRKTDKLYKLNNVFSSWDNIENTLSEYTSDDIWSKRIGNGGGGGYYSNVGQD